MLSSEISPVESGYTPPEPHPLGSRAKVLLTSIFGPYARDDAYGSRRINPMELYENQITRVQGPFSLRMFHRSFALLMIRENIDAPCTVLDYPDLKRFVRELKSGAYDIVGISGIVSNVDKVAKMCELIRVHSSASRIVVGGHVANIPDLEHRIDADFIVLGDGIRWFRSYLGENVLAPVRHPAVPSAFGTRILGVHPPESPADMPAILIPSVGCPMGCDFCSTSHLFGGKGRSVQFYKTGEELFTVMCELERKLKTRSFFVLDENFLFYRKRTQALLELMERHEKAWSFSVFSSANILREYSSGELVRLGVRWVWIGLEGKNSAYSKLHGTDTRHLVTELQSHGISVLGSSILGLDDHTPENITGVIDWAVSHRTDFHQFMLYTALPGTPLHRNRLAKKTLLSPEELPYADIHGQFRFNHRHEHLPEKSEADLLLRAFREDFEKNGPSLARLIRTMLSGWKKHKDHPLSRVRTRIRHDSRPLRFAYAGAMWSMKQWYRKNPHLFPVMSGLFDDLCGEFGWKTRLVAPVYGIFLLAAMHLEARRLERGWTYEPRTFREGPKSRKPSSPDLQAQSRCPRAEEPTRVWPQVPATQDPSSNQSRPPRGRPVPQGTC
ncbi:MAG: B12-binding domain-containing radical SAM protein [Candidatus Omnitrophota bacterium]